MARTTTSKKDGRARPRPARARPVVRETVPEIRSSAPARLYATKNDLSETTRTEVISLLNQRLAESIDLQTQCKQAHWNVKGPAFIGLHKLFDDINEDVEQYVDLIAERTDDLADLLSAVERFEAAVEAHGGDLMVDDLKSPQPDDRHFVLPRREHAEAIRVYISRIDAATIGLHRHPRRPD